ncbi:hypothetical protein MUU75_17660 [Pseudoxanthomonas mexicana]|uniref:hypothetical protein n=1 Tax=Pseudoxanthomonas mexicana TaxID=128785 RepID=UPI001FD70E56|nr:hypothetical protein [Pseudoxanthomonas mexicana]UOV04879.1 hypothetical protein MUU75_17660 [Pseudoxanthomonas mexicana]
MIRVSSILGWSLAVFTGSLHAQDFQRLDEEPETVGRYLLSMPARTLDPIIEHCSQKLPELREALLKERAGFIVKLGEASKPILMQLKDDPEFNAPVQDEMRQRVQTFNEDALGKFKQYDPAVTCPTGLANIQGATIDSLSQVVQDTYRSYLQVIRDKN